MAHPVGTGPYRLQWRRSSKIVLERNPGFREMSTTPSRRRRRRGAGAARALQGPAPADDRPRRDHGHRGAQPRWLAFLNGELDCWTACPTSSRAGAVPGGELAPNLAKRGIVRCDRSVNADVTLSTSTWRTRSSAATRPTRWRCAARSRWPTTSSARSACAAGRHRGAGHRCRRAPTATTRPSRPRRRLRPGARQGAARPLRLRGPRRRRLARAARRLAAGARVGDAPDQLARQLDEEWKKNMDGDRRAHRLRHPPVAREPEGRARRQAADVVARWSAARARRPAAPGPPCTAPTSARTRALRLPEFDAPTKRRARCPTAPSAGALFREAKQIGVAYMPYKMRVHRMYNDLVQPWVSATGASRFCATGGSTWTSTRAPAGGRRR